MKRIQPLKILLVSATIAMPLGLSVPLSSFAGQPGAPVCIVGSPYYPTIQSAVNDPNCDAINVPAGTYFENVTIGSVNSPRELTIRGAGPGSTTVDGSYNLAPVFSVQASAVTIKGMTITGGTGPSSGNNRNGGGISSGRSNITVKDSVITGNSAQGNGGGISFVFGTLTVKDSIVTNNVAHGTFGVNTGSGGGIRGAGTPNVMIVMDSVIADNVAANQGGGIFSGSPGSPSPQPGTLIVKDCTITGNEAPSGGGGIAVVNGALTVKDSSITENIPDDIVP